MDTPDWMAEFTLPLPGRHNVKNALAAIAAGERFRHLPGGNADRRWRDFRNLHQRSEILTLPGGVTVINDCYNSNPLAMERMLETLAAWPGARRRIVVAGEMLELGPSSPELHRGVGRKCAPSGVEWADRRARRRPVFSGRRRRGRTRAVTHTVFSRRQIRRANSAGP